MQNKFKIFRNKKIIITGFNGFKGTWLCIWLHLLNAKIYGISLKNRDKKIHYNIVKKFLNIKEYYIDIRDRNKVHKIFREIKPDYVFHLAAQAIVSKSVKDPNFNWETNVIGFLNILGSLSILKNKCTAVLITSDKCYKNFEKKSGYRETDILGGEDPYSASKASAEILFNSYFKTFFLNKKKSNIRVATARAGNVVGGGDWSPDRLIPDCMKSWLRNKKVFIRNPQSTRPWQHVLEALYGYLVLAVELDGNEKINGQSFNFSSNKIKNITVIDFLTKIKKLWPQISWKIKKSKKFHESGLLQLNNTKSKKILKWTSMLNINQTVELLVNWYLASQTNNKKIFTTSINQIKYFESKIR
jgi:CDP-glucose 4,6-dehydratase